MWVVCTCERDGLRDSALTVAGHTLVSPHTALVNVEQGEAVSAGSLVEQHFGGPPVFDVFVPVLSVGPSV